MSDHAALWALFALLWVALVLVIVTARRGPWQREPAIQRNKGAGILWITADAMPIRNDDGLAADLLAALRSGNPSGAPLPEVRILAPGVDPLWGNNPPWS